MSHVRRAVCNMNKYIDFLIFTIIFELVRRQTCLMSNIGDI
jgi:hypothetical protein